MLRIHIIAVASAAAMASALAANGAKAQTAGADQTGNPLSLSQLLTQTTASPAQPRDSRTTGRRRVRRIARRRHRFAAHHADQAADPAPSSVSTDDSRGANAAPANAAPASPPAPMAATDPARQDDAFLPAAVVVGGETVPIAAPDQINALDMAADNSPPVEPALPRGDGTDTALHHKPTVSQAVFDTQGPAMSAQSADDMMSAAQNTAARAMSAQEMKAQEPSAQAVAAQAVTPQDMSDQDVVAENSSTVGSAAWIAQVLAALGGAIAAGVLAWFLIGDGPVRTYR